MIRINLLSDGRRPTAVRKSRRPALGDTSRTNLALIGALALGVLAVLGYWFVLEREKGAVEEEVAIAQEEVERLRPILAEVEEFKVQQDDLQRKIDVITNLKNQQTGPVRVMDAVSRALPELLWLDRMEVTSNLIRLSGRAFNVNSVSNFIENLDKIPEFNEPKVARVSEKAGGEVYEFTIDVEYSLSPLEDEGGEEELVAAATAG